MEITSADIVDILDRLTALGRWELKVVTQYLTVRDDDSLETIMSPPQPRLRCRLVWWPHGHRGDPDAQHVIIADSVSEVIGRAVPEILCA